MCYSFNCLMKDISVVSEAFSLPIFEPLTSARLRKFTHVVMGCLNVAVSTAVAMSYPSVGTIHDESEAMAANIVHKSVCIRACCPIASWG